VIELIALAMTRVGLASALTPGIDKKWRPVDTNQSTTIKL
jgi:hypothetical protein